MPTDPKKGKKSPAAKARAKNRKEVKKFRKKTPTTASRVLGSRVTSATGSGKMKPTKSMSKLVSSVDEKAKKVVKSRTSGKKTYTKTKTKK